MIQMNLFIKQKQTRRLREGTHGYQGEVGVGEGLRVNDRLWVWDGYVPTSIFKMENQQGPTVQHKEPAQYSVIT